ncbi:sodium- and chloride-dependent neutral and basic amino acid transporter B(0+)-like [Musca vetustissima]|uniref:sodium- and chloride-dependent neutral and basic amino acid transporter B(0+)-like n=1 Tax=Musca vetustissima TaxID=27455 RepID=UPI002AB7D772|nr:sodium- and chloride-dependent neutral and basic amino acid transporter B(0+)-like [Musca vetustissima]
MVYETSYESGRQPFVPDTQRGNWLHPNDFIYAGLSLAFRVDIFSMSWYLSMESGVVSFLPVYLISLAVYIIPFIVIQSFMGQFSSSGFISAFRLSPLFKGIGYVTLAMNICVLTYYSIFAMVPLLYFFASLNPTLPWSCEGFKKWAQNLTDEQEINLCNMKFGNLTESNEGSGSGDSSNETSMSYNDNYINHHIPSVLYFHSLFHDINMFHYDDVEFSMSWQLILCALLVWVIVAVIVYKFFKTETFGVIIRYCVWTLLGLLLFLLIRFSFLPGAEKVYRHLFIPTWRDVEVGIAAIPIYGISAFGPGWGLFITLSSYNKFKTNIVKYSWIIGLGQFFLMLGIDMLQNFTEVYLRVKTDNNYYSEVENIWTLYLSSGSVMADMPWPNFWSMLLYFMLFLSALLLILIQFNSILTTIFDEFVKLREKKLEVAMGLVGLMTAVSLYFTSNHGITYFTALAVDTYTTHTAINLLLILVVLWIYGRVRFQRDFEFMTNHRFSTWNINILRFVAPLGMLVALLLGIIVAFYEHMLSNVFIAILGFIFMFLPWLFIPGYAAHSMLQSLGSFKTRFQRCCRPTDWYPTQAEDRQRYEEAMGNMEITHQLNEVTDEVL